MSEIAPLYTRMAPAKPSSIAKVNRLADVLREMPQVPFVTEHMLHGGMYTRTVRLPADTVVAAVLIKVPTVLIFVGAADIYCDDDLIKVAGYSVLPGSAGRKVAFVTYTMVAMSMLFPTTAKTIEEAEREFTDEHDLLVPLSRTDEHRILITGE